MRYICRFCGSTHDSRFLADLCEATDIKCETIRHLVYSFGACNTTAEINSIINDNLEFMNENPRTFKHAMSARKRILKMRKAKLQLTEKIYLN